MKAVSTILVALYLLQGSQAFQSTSPCPQRISLAPSQYDVSSTKALTERSSSLSGRSRSSSSSTTLQASPIDVLSSPAGSLAILAGIILVHESGHYLAARAFGIEVEEFAIGFGPKVFGFTALGNDFNVRAFPLGGYVRFPENYNATLVQELETQAYDAAIAKQQAPPKTLGFRLANLLSLGSLEKRKRQSIQDELDAEEERIQNLPAWKQVKAREDRQKELGIMPVDIPYDDNPNLLQNRPWTERAVVISGGVVFNILLSFSIYFGQIGGSVGIPSPIFEPGVKVGSIPQANAAAKGVLQSGDVILQANGAPLTSSSSPTVFEAQKGINDLISIIRATPDGDELELSIIRNEKDQVENIKIKPKRVSGPQTIGVMLTPNYIKSQNLKSDNPVEAARLAFDYTKTLTTETANGLIKYLSQSFSGGGGNSGAQVSGPIGLIREGSKVVETKNLQTVLLFAAAISINLGVVNAFPLPALDGGQLVFVLWEAVTRRKIDQKVQEGINGAAVLILLLVSAEAAIGDLFKLFN